MEQMTNQQQFGVAPNQFGQPGAAGQFNSMFANMGMPETPIGGQVMTDPNEWQLQCDAQHENVEAIIRVLPRGLEGVQGNLWPHVNCKKHYLKTRDGQRWGQGPIVCRGNIPDPTSKYGKSYCPTCKETWDRYYKIKSQWGDQAAKDSGLSSNLPVDDIYVNVLVISDFVHPENNGQIKIWHAKTKQWEKIMAALPERNVNKNGQAKQQYTSTQKYVGIPWHVLSGSNFHLRGTWDSTKSWGQHRGAAVWDASDFDPTPTPIGNSDDAIMQILGQCHDLSKYEIAPKSVEELEADTRAFYAAYDGAVASPDNHNNIAQNGYATFQQQSPYGQPAAPAQGGMMPASQPSQYVPPQPKTTVGNAGAFFNNPAAPNYGMAAPAQQNAFVQPAAPAATPAQQSVFAQPAAPAQPASQFAAPAQPAAAPQASYVPPAAPAPQPNQFAAPAAPATPAGQPGQPGAPIVQMDDDSDLPF